LNVNNVIEILNFLPKFFIYLLKSKIHHFLIILLIRLGAFLKGDGSSSESISVL
jgi:hypothetical protein